MLAPYLPYICIMDIMVSQCSASSFLQSPIQYSADILQFSNGTIYKIMVDVGWRMDMMIKLKNLPLRRLCRPVTCILSSSLLWHNPSRGPSFCLMDKRTHKRVEHVEVEDIYT